MMMRTTTLNGPVPVHAMLSSSKDQSKQQCNQVKKNAESFFGGQVLKNPTFSK
jgi:hypothetical protein